MQISGFFGKISYKSRSFSLYQMSTPASICIVMVVSNDRLDAIMYPMELRVKWRQGLALTGQFKQLSHEPEKFRWLKGIRTHDLCDAGAVL